MYVGYFGTGSLTISAGGAVSNTIGYGGLCRRQRWRSDRSPAPAPPGTPAIRFTSVVVELVAGGTGTVTIRPGGTVNVAEDTVLYPRGLLKLEGGTLVTDTLDDRGGVFAWTSGTLRPNGRRRPDDRPR